MLPFLGKGTNRHGNELACMCIVQCMAAGLDVDPFRPKHLSFPKDQDGWRKWFEFTDTRYVKNEFRAYLSRCPLCTASYEGPASVGEEVSDFGAAPFDALGRSPGGLEAARARALAWLAAAPAAANSLAIDAILAAA